MNKMFLDWVDQRTNYRKLMDEALYENIPGGARWRYIWGSTLTFTFTVQVVTGLFLWMYYSPSTQTAWESVYYLQTHVGGGWLLRGVHHYTAQAMVVLLAFHLAQVVIDGAYKAPREFNFWLGLVLMLIVLGLALTGYLLPWDQKGYWATKVATRIAGLTPVVGAQMERVVVGGPDYGHYTLTRFFALHAGVLPTLLVLFLALHLSLFRRHGVTVRPSAVKRPDQYFWPEQVLRDAVACLVILAIVITLSVYFRPELGAPADGADAYAAARPEWYFLFLFQFLKLFHGETGEVIGAIVIPGALMLFMFSMPVIGRSRAGHAVCVTAIGLVLTGAALLTIAALYEDHQARWFPKRDFTDVEQVLNPIEVDLRVAGQHSKYHGKSESERLAIYFGGDQAKLSAFNSRLAAYRAYTKSRDYLRAVADAEQQSQRAHELANKGIPAEGALSLLRHDPLTQGPKLFRRNCAACHDCVDPAGNGIVSSRPLDYPRDPDGRWLKDKKPIPNGAPNLYGFGSRAWLSGFLDPEKISAVVVDDQKAEIRDAPYFGNTMHRAGRMSKVVKKRFSNLDAAGRTARDRLVAVLSAEAELPSQREADAELDKEATAKLPQDASASQRQKAVIDARTQSLKSFKCTECHTFHGEEGGDAPDLTGYGSRKWMLDFIGNPAHERFYGKTEVNEGNDSKGNDRMPAFAADPKQPEKNRITPRDLKLIVDWLRGEWYVPPPAAKTP